MTTNHDDIEVVRERYRRQAAQPITITLTHEEWQQVLAAMYRACLADARDATDFDAGMRDTDEEYDPIISIDAIARTHTLRKKVHDLMHAGEDQASWSPEGD